MRNTFFKYMRVIVVFHIFLLSCSIVFAESGPTESVRKFSSNNGRFEIEIKLEGDHDNSPSECIFKDNGKIIWQKELPATPGRVNIADNGMVVVMANWGWYDEGGYKSLSVYDEKGKLKSKIDFEETMVVDNTDISSDGRYFALGRGGWIDLYSIEPFKLISSLQGVMRDKTDFTMKMRDAIKKYEENKSGRVEAQFSHIAQEKAVEIAKEYAKKKGINLDLFPKVSAKFDEVKQSWDISFMMDPMPPGGWFSPGFVLPSRVPLKENPDFDPTGSARLRAARDQRECRKAT